MDNLLGKYAKILIAAQDPNVMRRLFESIVVNHPDAVIHAGNECGIVTDAMKVTDAFRFPVEYLDMKIFNDVKAIALGAPSRNYSPKIEAIKELRRLTGCGLKEAKDFVEHYYPGSSLSVY